MSSDQSQVTHRSAQSVSNVAVPRDKLTWGTVSLVTWLFLFSAGLLIETVDYRLILAPRSVSKQLGDVKTKKVLEQTSGKIPPEPAATTETTANESRPSVVQSFILSMLCFTPINLALLALAAGLAGGCSSNIALETMPREEQAALLQKERRRHLYLQEPPVSAAIRGFIVYLCVIAGLYIVMDDPFRDPTPSQYIRIAGTLSAVAFLVGYDPTRLEDWLRLIPGPGRAIQEPPPDDVSRRQPTELSSPDEVVQFAMVPATQAEAAKKEQSAEEDGSPPSDGRT